MGKKGSWFSAIKRVFTNNSKEKRADVSHSINHNKVLLLLNDECPLLLFSNDCLIRLDSSISSDFHSVVIDVILGVAYVSIQVANLPL